MKWIKNEIADCQKPEWYSENQEKFYIFFKILIHYLKLKVYELNFSKIPECKQKKKEEIIDRPPLPSGERFYPGTYGFGILHFMNNFHNENR